jgi:flagellar biosynthesis protein FliR
VLAEPDRELGFLLLQGALGAALSLTLLLPWLSLDLMGGLLGSPPLLPDRRIGAGAQQRGPTTDALRTVLLLLGTTLFLELGGHHLLVEGWMSAASSLGHSSVDPTWAGEPGSLAPLSSALPATLAAFLAAGLLLALPFLLLAALGALAVPGLARLFTCSDPRLLDEELALALLLLGLATWVAVGLPGLEPLLRSALGRLSALSGG